MVRLRARPQHRLLHLDEIADPGTLAQHRTGAQPRIGPDTRTFTHTRAFQMAERMDHRLVRHRYAGAEHDVGLDRHVAADRGIVREPHRFGRSEEHTSELQSLMRISYAVFCLKKKKTNKNHNKQS